MATDGPHDLGGRPGFGPVPVDAEAPWSAAWQPFAYALASSTARIAGVNGDALRHVMERLPPEQYRRLDSAGRWLAAAERLRGGGRARGRGRGPGPGTRAGSTGCRHGRSRTTPSRWRRPRPRGAWALLPTTGGHRPRTTSRASLRATGCG